MKAISENIERGEPQIEFAGDVELSDEAIESLAALLLELAELEETTCE